MNKIIHPMEPEELMAYLDGELSADQSAIAAAHLNDCGECREVVAGLRRVSQGLEAWELKSVDYQVSTAVVVALEENAGRQGKAFVVRKTWRRLFRQHWQAAAWAGGFAVFALVTYMGTQSLTGGKETQALAPITDRPAAERRSEHPTQYNYAPAPSPNAKSQAERVGKVVVGLTSELSTQLEAPDAQAEKAARGGSNLPTVSGPMIIRTAQLSLITKDFDDARASVESILKRHRGYVADLKTGGATGSGRTLNATLRVPADQLDASLIDLKALGRVESESQSGQDVTSQYVDLQARLANSRNTEQRLTDLLRNRTGKLSDVLEVEQEVDRVRGEIEQMEAERKNMSNQVSFATLNVAIAEDYKAQLQVVPPSTWTRLSNASVEGYKSMVEGVMSLALFLLENGPSLLLWIAILFMPARLVWKRVRRSFAH
jgi:anti-sigma factor RsiW